VCGRAFLLMAMALSWSLAGNLTTPIILTICFNTV
jgi:hypothetical protein